MSENNSSSPSSRSRRGFLKTTTGLALAGAGTILLSGTAQARGSHHGWHHSGHGNTDKHFWKKVSKEFILDKKQPT